jgi:uncharacterized protein YsxB (DUF464 family)
MDNEVEEVKISGHGGGKVGEDILCSAVSAIGQTALSGLLHYANRNIAWRSEKGELYIEVKRGTERDERSVINVILTTMLLGLKGIAQQYPQRIELEIDGELLFL